MVLQMGPKIGEMSYRAFCELLGYNCGKSPQGNEKRRWHPDAVGLIETSPETWKMGVIGPSKAVRSSENRCREMFERLTGLKWPKCRPSWLRNPLTGYPMELDGYCAELNAAFEYQGYQHSSWVRFYHPDRRQYDAQRHRDDNKKIICSERQGFTLIEIPHYLNLNSTDQEWMDYVRAVLDELDSLRAATG